MNNSQMSLSYATFTNIGNRAVNEDSLGVLTTSNGVYFLVCDGLGGHGGGDMASSLVVEMMKQKLGQGVAIEKAILESQDELLKEQRRQNATDKMKTTLTCLWIREVKALFAHVGDSRIYHFEKNKMVRRSQDHSVPQMLYESGQIKEKDIRHHADRSRLLRVMGTEWKSPKYQITKDIPVTKRSSFLLCSDGFWELIDEKQMCKVLKKSATPEDWLNQMAQIIKENGQGTNMDNYTAIAVFVR